MRRWLLGQFERVVSDYILDELEHHAFASQYFRERLTAEEIHRHISLFRREATVVEVSIVVRDVAPDPDDDEILAAAVSADTDFLVTGDQRLRAVDTIRNVQIRTPRELLTMLESGPALID